MYRVAPSSVDQFISRRSVVAMRAEGPAPAEASEVLRRKLRGAAASAIYSVIARASCVSASLGVVTLVRAEDGPRRHRALERSPHRSGSLRRHASRERPSAHRNSARAPSVDVVGLAHVFAPPPRCSIRRWPCALRARRFCEASITSRRHGPASPADQTRPCQFPRRGTVAAARAACFCWHSEHVPYISCLCVLSTKPYRAAMRSWSSSRSVAPRTR